MTHREREVVPAGGEVGVEGGNLEAAGLKRRACGVVIAVIIAEGEVGCCAYWGEDDAVEVGVEEGDGVRVGGGEVRLFEEGARDGRSG